MLNKMSAETKARLTCFVNCAANFGHSFGCLVVSSGTCRSLKPKDLEQNQARQPIYPPTAARPNLEPGMGSRFELMLPACFRQPLLPCALARQS